MLMLYGMIGCCQGIRFNFWRFLCYRLILLTLLTLVLIHFMMSILNGCIHLIMCLSALSVRNVWMIPLVLNFLVSSRTVGLKLPVSLIDSILTFGGDVLKRYPVHPGADKSYFKRTAAKIKAINLPYVLYRGGFRF